MKCCNSEMRKDGKRLLVDGSHTQKYYCPKCDTYKSSREIAEKKPPTIEEYDELPNILVIGDTHIPFEHDEYLGLCKRIYKRHNCKIAVHIGDLVDNHSINFFEHNPNGLSSKGEVLLAKKILPSWYEAFPNVRLCKGNHDLLPSRRAIKEGIAEDYMKSFRELWELPDTWLYEDSWQIGGIKFFHGTGYSGKYPHANAAQTEMQSIVMGHCHSVAGDYWLANDLVCMFGLSVGCGIDRRKYAFAYGKVFKRKPILGVGLVTDNGEDARFIRMRL